MKLIKLALAVLIVSAALIVNAELSVEDQQLFEQVMEQPGLYQDYDKPEILKSKDKLLEVEEKLSRLKKITSIYPDEPRIYYAISELYSVRDTMLHRNLVFKGNAEWFSLPVVQENLQGIRDNLTVVARLLEEGKGTPIKVWGAMSSVISIQLYERFERLYMKQNPNGLECNDPENQECMPVSYEGFALKKLIDIAKEYQAYGYFDDADRLLNEIENFSKEGAAKVAELRPYIKK